MSITSEIIESIKLSLGGNILKLELNDDQIEILLKSAYKKISPYANELKDISIPAGVRVYDFENEDVIDVIKVVYADSSSLYKAPFPESLSMKNRHFAYNGGHLPLYKNYRKKTSYQLLGSMLMHSMPIIDRGINFKFSENKLYISGGSTDAPMTATCIVKLSDISNLKNERVIAWLTDYTLALCKESIGRIRSRFSPQTANYKFDGEILLSEAHEDKARLESELKSGKFSIEVVVR